MPHSVFGRPLHRPSRADAPAAGRAVKGMQPTEVKPNASSGWRGRRLRENCIQLGAGEPRQRIELKATTLGLNSGQRRPLTAMKAPASADPTVESRKLGASGANVGQSTTGITIVETRSRFGSRSANSLGNG